ncbi:putative ATP-dependent protease [Erwinia phage pEa_SNUABM_8]|nr:putative ATP-dependent protease [Erwinia phage pEa_SNUABM_8]QVW54891.1 hypothetical protein pEaSNUABM4_00138 [Erwinia phage pEa_SNUABM_4]
MDNLTPVEIVKVFDQFVHGQHMAKKMLAIALRNRFRVASLGLRDRGSVKKQNLLLIGPTGSGKTALMRVLRQRFGLPVLELDMTGFSETGYVGRNVNTIGADLSELVRATPLPDWYVKLRTGMEVEKDEARYTRQEWDALQRKEYEAEKQEEDTERRALREAKQKHTLQLQSMGILPDDAEYAQIQRIFYLRAMLLGYSNIQGIPYDDFDIRTLELMPGQTVQTIVRKVLSLLEGVLGRDITGMRDLNADTMGDMDLESAIEEKPEFMADVMGLMGLANTLEMYMERGLELMGSNPVAACVSGGDWYDAAYTLDGEKQDIPPGILWKYSDSTGHLLHWIFQIAFEYEAMMDEFWSVEDFTRFADEKLWTFDIPKAKPEFAHKTGVISKKDLLKVDNCNGRDFVENFAVVFLDEFDKLVESDRANHAQVSRSGVQRSLLKMVEGGLYGAIDTTNVLFVAAGTFAEAPLAKLLPELQGRFPLRANLEPLDKDALEAICRLDSSDFHGMIKLLALEGVKVLFDNDTYSYIAEQTIEANRENNLGARRLDAIVERIFQAALYEPEKYLEHGYDVTGATLRRISD